MFLVADSLCVVFMVRVQAFVIIIIIITTVMSNIMSCSLPGDRLCGLVVRVLGYRSGGPGSIPGTTRKKVVRLERGQLCNGPAFLSGFFTVPRWAPLCNGFLYFVRHFGRHFVTVRLSSPLHLLYSYLYELYLSNTLTLKLSSMIVRDSSSGRLGLTQTKHFVTLKLFNYT
jgi:hypothetical protein